MNELDFILVFIVFVGVVVGLRRGVIRVLISIVGIYLTVVIAGYVYEPMGRTISGAASDLNINLGLTAMYNFSYLVTVIFITVVVETISRTAFEDTRILALRGLDNLLGGIVGILYGALWASLLLTPVQYSQAWTLARRESTLLPTLNDVFRTVVLDIVHIFFGRSLPAMYYYGVPEWISQLFPRLTAFHYLLF